MSTFRQSWRGGEISTFLDVPKSQKMVKNDPFLGHVKKLNHAVFCTFLGVQNDPQKGHLQPIRRPKPHFWPFLARGGSGFENALPEALRRARN